MSNVAVSPLSLVTEASLYLVTFRLIPVTLALLLDLITSHQLSQQTSSLAFGCIFEPTRVNLECQLWSVSYMHHKVIHCSQY